MIGIKLFLAELDRVHAFVFSRAVGKYTESEQLLLVPRDSGVNGDGCRVAQTLVFLLPYTDWQLHIRKEGILQANEPEICLYEPGERFGVCRVTIFLASWGGIKESFSRFEATSGLHPLPTDAVSSSGTIPPWRSRSSMKKGSVTRRFMVNVPSRTRSRSRDALAGYVLAQEMVDGGWKLFPTFTNSSLMTFAFWPCTIYCYLFDLYPFLCFPLYRDLL